MAEDGTKTILRDLISAVADLAVVVEQLATPRGDGFAPSAADLRMYLSAVKIALEGARSEIDKVD